MGMVGDGAGGGVEVVGQVEPRTGHHLENAATLAACDRLVEL
jgi:hypothetical protein